MKSPTLNVDMPNPVETLRLPHGTNESAAIKIAEIDSVKVREAWGQGLFDIVLECGKVVTVLATDQNFECLLESIHFMAAPPPVSRVSPKILKQDSSTGA